MNNLVLVSIVHKYGLPGDCSREKLVDTLQIKKLQYEYELMHCLKGKSEEFVSTVARSRPARSTVSEMSRNAEEHQDIADEVNQWRCKVLEVEQDLRIIGEENITSKINCEGTQGRGDLGNNYQNTRDCTEAAVLLEGSDLRIHNNRQENGYMISRPVYTQHEFDLNHGGTMKKLSWKIKCCGKMTLLKEKSCSTTVWKSFMMRTLPFIMIMRKYKWKEWVLADIIAGIIVGVMHIPQSMAYSMLAGLDPMYGLYVSFFPALIYFFLGTSRHNSMGTIAVVSLLSGKFLDKSVLQFPFSTNGTDNSTFNPALGQLKASRAAGLTLCVGLVQISMYVFQLGFLTRYLSDPLISGFTVGAAVHVLTSQVKSCFGITIPKQYGVFNIPMTYYHIFKNLSFTNIPTVVMTLISIIVLVITKEYINPTVVKKIRVPIPMELIVVVCGTAASHYLQLNKLYKVKIVGKISQGLPAPALPDLSNMTSFISDIFITAIIAFSICVSLAKIFGKKHGYSIDPNQECLAYGAMNIFSSFFLCYTSAASLSRSAVQESIGGKTQLTSLLASGLVLFVVLFIGPLFHSLPQCILASIIVVALKGMFMHFIELKELWIFSYWDFATWVVSFLATMILDIDYGLMIGVGLSILTVMLRTQSPNSHILGQISGTDIYKNVTIYDESQEVGGVKIFRYEGSLYYACSDHFRKTLYAKVKCNPRKILEKINKYDQRLKKLEKKIKTYDSLNEGEGYRVSQKLKKVKELLEVEKDLKVHHVIIDCSTWGYIDFVGVKTLHQVIEEYKTIKVSVLLANPKTDIREMFARSKCYKVIDDRIIYVSVHDAVINSLFEHKMKSEERPTEDVSSL